MVVAAYGDKIEDSMNMLCYRTKMISKLWNGEISHNDMSIVDLIEKLYEDCSILYKDRFTIATILE